MSSDLYSKSWKVWNAAKELRDSGVLQKNNIFWLEPLIVAGAPVRYTVRFENGKMSEHWKDARLVPTGCKPWELGRLPPLSNENLDKYEEAVLEVVNRVKKDPDLMRLEGVITVHGDPEVVRLFVIPAFQSDDRDWMVIQVLSTNADGVVVRQNGTGHGDPW